ncbi:MAG: hypothetical protein HGA19_07255 [Oscillochloris sp.]|nr:hypothetical protein [Oscillochloris sp.]
MQCYEQDGELRAAAETLVAFGTPAASTEAAHRFLILDDLPAAGEAFLAAGQPRAARECFQRAHMPERELVCLQALGDHAAAGALLLEQGRHAEAAPILEQALDTTPTTSFVQRVTLYFQLAQALGEPAGQPHYRMGLTLLVALPANVESAGAWLALAAWGMATGRQDRIQEGYAQALRLLAQAGDTARWNATATRYRAAAQHMGNRNLAQMRDEGCGVTGEGCGVTGEG